MAGAKKTVARGQPWEDAKTGGEVERPANQSQRLRLSSCGLQAPEQSSLHDHHAYKLLTRSPFDLLHALYSRDL